MSEVRGSLLSWLFVALIAVAGVIFFAGVRPVGASGDHDHAQGLRHDGEIMPLAEILGRAELAGMRVLEAELEREQGSLVYELQLLDGSGQVHKRYFDAANGEPLNRREGD